VGFGYVMNQMGPAAASLMDPRCAALIDAVYASI
jgi:hypothetical protein